MVVPARWCLAQVLLISDYILPIDASCKEKVDNGKFVRINKDSGIFTPNMLKKRTAGD